jgi:hypothetical protein
MSVVRCPLLIKQEVIERHSVGRTGFENLHVYSLAEEIGDLVLAVVNKFDNAQRTTDN